jgi:peptidoglycan/xylan/chitin deacetylase (PgdA/CDA1 family)
MQPSVRTALSAVGLQLGRLTQRFRFRSTLRILYYHSISNLPVRSSVAPEAFTAQMEYLRAHGYQVLSLAEAVHYLTAHTPFSEKSVVLTFDDGFSDNYEHAFPVLERLQLPATIFLAASYVGSERLPTLTRTDFIPQPLTWEQVREMQGHGVEFGSHTLTHLMLSQATLQDVRYEVRESKRLIEDRLGAPVHFFCYPRGDFTRSVQQIVRDEGYRAACTIRPGVNDWRSNLFTLRRTYISRRDTLAEFAKKMAGAYDLLQQAQHAWRQLRRL